MSVFAWLVSLPTLSSAADNVWIGGAGNGNFSDVANWASAPSWSYGNSLIFQANTSATTLNFNIAPQPVNDIYYDTLFPVARTLQTAPGGAIYFKTRLENLSAYTQTIDMPLLGGYDGAVAIQLNPVGGSLVISGDFYNDFNKSYAVFGSTTPNVTSLILNTGIGLRGSDQASINFTVASGRNIAVQVNASQIWQGRTEIQAGTFTTASLVQLASPDIVLNGGDVTTTSANTFADLAALTVNAGRLSVGGSDTVGSLAGSGGTVVLASAARLTAGGANTSTSYAGAISGSGGFTKLGSGTFTLGGVNTYTGSTSVVGGGLNLAGSIAGSLSVASVARLTGTGTAGGNALIAGIHSPGNSPGAQTFNADLTYEGGAIVNWELIANTTAAAGTNYDQIIMPAGNLTFSGSTTLALSFDAAGSAVDWSDAFWNVNRSWMIYDLSGGTTTSLGNLTIGGSLLDSLGNPLSPTSRGSFTTSLSGQDVMLNFVAVPEPSMITISLVAIVCGGWLNPRRRPA